MKKYEYKTVSIYLKELQDTFYIDDHINDRLNEYGRKGWELISVERVVNRLPWLNCVFKREIKRNIWQRLLNL